MSEFKPIETQEDLDNLIKDRISRVENKYSDYEDIKKKVNELSEENQKLAEAVKTSSESKGEFEKTISELTSKVKAYETDSVKTRIALETGLPWDLASRLNGATEDEIRKDAEGLAKFMVQPVAPISSNEPQNYNPDNQSDALKQVLKNLNLKGE